ncbi:hypothetical protein GOP47_0029090 [Adiantum capillus-veneris]|nr:hypothetical protein GOP47_0029090 [Adiantum capillus-veneris]
MCVQANAFTRHSAENRYTHTCRSSKGLVMDRHRAALEIYEVPGMFQQAAASFKASLPLLLTLALLSSVYETAVERSALLSGFSFSSQNSNFSFQFALDPKTQAAQSPNAVNTGGLKKFDTADSLLSRLLTALLPPDDQPSQHAGLKEEEPAGHKEQLKHTAASVPGSSSNEGNAVASESLQTMEHPPASSSMQGGLSADEENTREAQQEMDAIDNSESTHEEAGAKHDRVSFVGGDSEDDDMQLEHGFDNFGKVEDDTDVLPRLEIETASNETRKVVQESAIDAIDLTFFTGKLLGGRGLDQGALPHGGLTVLLILLLVAVAVTVFLAVVGFQHAAVLGSVAFSVVSTHMGKRASARQAIKSSLKSSIGRLMWLAILHATLRGLLDLFFMKTLFGGIMEMEQVETLVLRLSAAPFAILAPFMDADATSPGMAVRIGLFVGFDYLFDSVAYCIYMIACWVTILERNYWGLGAVTRSGNLVKGMKWQALVIRLIEAAVCGRTARWLLQHVIARSLHDQPSHFSYRTLEDFLDRFR